MAETEGYENIRIIEPIGQYAFFFFFFFPFLRDGIWFGSDGGVILYTGS
jgi:hypothetical protein